MEQWKIADTHFFEVLEFKFLGPNSLKMVDFIKSHYFDRSDQNDHIYELNMADGGRNSKYGQTGNCG